MEIVRTSLVIMLLFVPEMFTDGRSNRVKRIVGGNPADVAGADDPVVFLHHAGKSAKIRGTYESSHYQFKGIRYAYNPTGADRFQRARKYFLDGDYDATAYGLPCIQPVPGVDEVTGSEDCLFLNVFTSNLPDGSEGLPVLVWIHGNSYRYGSASQYGVKHLVNKSLVVVSIQYRLGLLGFLSTGEPTLPGNSALFDMALAVEWVRNHISFFGGNPYKINIMGHGTGGSSVLLMTLSDILKDVISGVIAMSGTALSNWAIDKNPTETTKEFADLLGCPSSNVKTRVKCLQSKKPEVIVKVDSYIEAKRLKERGFLSALSDSLTASPVTEGINDGRLLPAAIQRKPLVDMYAGNIPKIPLLTGVTQHETKRAVQGQYRKEVVKKLNVTDFLTKTIFDNLQSVIHLSGIEQVTMKSDQFGGYFSKIGNTIEDILVKIADITADALFNLPAVLTANYWSKSGAPSYLYRFEHSGKAKKGDFFLKGAPIIGNQSYTASPDLNGSVCHGDDLAYLFEAQNLDGSPLREPEVYDAEDESVREVFTKLIADFARNGTVNINNRGIRSFTLEDNYFIKIKAKPEVDNNFQMCEMALWTGVANKLKSSACKLFDVPKIPQIPILNVPSIPTVNVPPLPLPGISKFPFPMG